MPCSWARAANGNNATDAQIRRRNGHKGDMKSVPRREKGAELAGRLEFSGEPGRLSKDSRSETHEPVPSVRDSTYFYAQRKVSRLRASGWYAATQQIFSLLAR